MNGIVHASVNKVANDKARKKSKNIMAYPKQVANKIQNTKNYRCNNNAGYRRHKQPLFITGILVVIAMNNIYNTCSHLAFGYKMKYKPVDNVFKKRPEKYAC